MKTTWKDCSILLLQWVVGLVILLESLRTFNRGLHHVSVHGIHPVILLALAGPEAVAAVLFLIPRTLILGSYALLVIFALAVLVHLLHGQWNFEILLVYAAAVLVVMSTQELEVRGWGLEASAAAPPLVSSL